MSDATNRAVIDDTYAEAFRSIYAEILVTARDRKWLDTAVSAATGNASSSMLCDCEAGLDRYVEPAETPDGRPGAVVQFHVPRFWKDRLQRLERSVLVRVSQNVLTCPTTAAFNVLPADGENWFPTWDSDVSGYPHAVRVTVVAAADEREVTAAARRVTALDRTPLPLVTVESSTPTTGGGR